MNNFINEITVSDISTIIGAFIGTLIAGAITLLATQKQINHFKKSQIEHEKANQKRTLLIIKSYLDRPVRLVKGLKDNDFIFIQTLGDWSILDMVKQDISSARSFIDANVYNINPATLNGIFELIKTIDTASEYAFMLNTSTHPNEIDEFYKKNNLNQIEDRLNEHMRILNF